MIDKGACEVMHTDCKKMIDEKGVIDEKRCDQYEYKCSYETQVLTEKRELVCFSDGISY